jgi:hypothetical protein
MPATPSAPSMSPRIRPFTATAEAGAATKEIAQ